MKRRNFKRLIVVLLAMLLVINSGLGIFVAADSNGIFTTSDSGGTQNENHYALKSDVYVRVEAFDVNDQLYVEVIQTQGNTSLGTNTITKVLNINGKFVFKLYTLIPFGNSANGEYRVEVSKITHNGLSGKKSDNFRVGPEPTLTPKPTHIPEVTLIPTPTQVPKVTSTPTPTQVPEVTSTPTPTQVPEVTSTPTPTQVPEVTSTPTPTQIPEVTSTPTPTQVPEVTSTPTPTQVPEVTPTPVVIPTEPPVLAIPTVTPTPVIIPTEPPVLAIPTVVPTPIVIPTEPPVLAAPTVTPTTAPINVAIETPLALPQTGGTSPVIFYGIGTAIAGLGVLFNRKK